MLTKFNNFYAQIDKTFPKKFKTSSYIINRFGITTGDAQASATNPSSVPYLRVERTYLNTNVQWSDLIEHTGCNDKSTIYHCGSADDYTLYLSHDFKNGLEYNMCDLKTFHKGYNKKIADMESKLSEDTARGFDQKHLKVIKETSPKLTFDVVDGTNILKIIRDAGNGLLSREGVSEIGWTKTDVVITLPNKYRPLFEEAYKAEFQVAATIDDMMVNGVAIGKLDGFRIEFTDLFDFIWASTDDAWDVGMQCFNNFSIYRWEDNENEKVKARIHGRTGGGYAYRYKSTVDSDWEYILGSVVVEIADETAVTNTYEIIQPGMVNQGLRVMPKTAQDDYNEAVQSAADDLQASVTNKAPIIKVGNNTYEGTDNKVTLAIPTDVTEITDEDLISEFSISAISQGINPQVVAVTPNGADINTLPIVDKVYTATHNGLSSEITVSVVLGTIVKSAGLTFKQGERSLENDLNATDKELKELQAEAKKLGLNNYEDKSYEELLALVETAKKVEDE